MPLYAEICQNNRKYARNLHKYANLQYMCIISPKYALYADMCVICFNMHNGKYAINADLNVQKYA